MAKANYSFLIIVLFVYLGCNNPTEKPPNVPINILAEIGNKTITVNDFIKRCEYVPRPVYCRGDNYIHKKISLNSLIAEKIFSIEFDRRNYDTTNDQKNFIQGQKEQSMRQLMLKRFGFDKVKIDTSHIRFLSMLSNRRYEIHFINLDPKHKETLLNLPLKSSIDDISTLLNLKIKSTKKIINKNDNMINEVKQILYFSEPVLNALYGPFKTQENSILCFEVRGWNKNVDITEKQKKDTWDETIKVYSEELAKKYYGKYVSNLLKGKSIKFDPEIFPLFSKKLSKIYLIEKNKKEAVIENRIWNQKEETEFASFDDIRKMKNQVILTHGQKQYKISELLDLIKKHPLVFRKKSININQFSNELKYAVADLIRDVYITKEAYSLGLDKNILVINNEKKWEDYIKSLSLNNLIIKKNSPDSTPTKKLIMIVDSLQNEYSDIIKIDTDKFEKIKLSRVDMSVMYSNQPYTKLEPDFPIITNDHILDYGQKVNFLD
tara:strand:+ start:1719 stop:3194 length:1476 start_codon:yes stop_codon:yes gene_type:complete